MTFALVFILTILSVVSGAPAKEENFVKDEYIARLDLSVSVPETISALRKLYFKTLEQISISNDLIFLHLKGNEKLLDTVSDLEGLEYIIPNYKSSPYQHCFELPSPGTWGLDRLDQRLPTAFTEPTSPDATYTHGNRDGLETTVYVVDTGKL